MEFKYDKEKAMKLAGKLNSLKEEIFEIKAKLANQERLMNWDPVEFKDNQIQYEENICQKLNEVYITLEDQYKNMLKFADMVTEAEAKGIDAAFYEIIKQSDLQTQKFKTLPGNAQASITNILNALSENGVQIETQAYEASMLQDELFEFIESKEKVISPEEKAQERETEIEKNLRQIYKTRLFKTDEEANKLSFKDLERWYFSSSGFLQTEYMNFSKDKLPENVPADFQRELLLHWTKVQKMGLDIRDYHVPTSWYDYMGSYPDSSDKNAVNDFYIKYINPIVAIKNPGMPTIAQAMDWFSAYCGDDKTFADGFAEGILPGLLSSPKAISEFVQHPEKVLNIINEAKELFKMLGNLGGTFEKMMQLPPEERGRLAGEIFGSAITDAILGKLAFSAAGYLAKITKLDQFATGLAEKMKRIQNILSKLKKFDKTFVDDMEEVIKVSDGYIVNEQNSTSRYSKATLTAQRKAFFKDFATNVKPSG